MKFLIDAQLPPGLATWLAGQGHAADHVGGLMLLSAADREIWEYAERSGTTIVTKDEDFPTRSKRSASGPAVVWLRIGNSTNRSLFAWLEPRWPTVMRLLAEGNRLIEVR